MDGERYPLVGCNAAFNCLAQEDDEVDGECVLITFSFAHFATHFCPLCAQALLLLRFCCYLLHCALGKNVIQTGREIVLALAKTNTQGAIMKNGDATFAKHLQIVVIVVVVDVVVISSYYCCCCCCCSFGTLHKCAQVPE